VRGQTSDEILVGRQLHVLVHPRGGNTISSAEASQDRSVSGRFTRVDGCRP
jgi:hypothetical protein